MEKLWFVITVVWVINFILDIPVIWKIDPFMGISVATAYIMAGAVTFMWGLGKDFK